MNTYLDSIFWYLIKKDFHSSLFKQYKFLMHKYPDFLFTNFEVTIRDQIMSDMHEKYN